MQLKPAEDSTTDLNSPFFSSPQHSSGDDTLSLNPITRNFGDAETGSEGSSSVKNPTQVEFTSDGQGDMVVVARDSSVSAEGGGEYSQVTDEVDNPVILALDKVILSEGRGQKRKLSDVDDPIANFSSWKDVFGRVRKSPNADQQDYLGFFSRSSSASPTKELVDDHREGEGVGGSNGEEQNGEEVDSPIRGVEIDRMKQAMKGTESFNAAERNEVLPVSPADEEMIVDKRGNINLFDLNELPAADDEDENDEGY